MGEIIYYFAFFIIAQGFYNMIKKDEDKRMLNLDKYTPDKAKETLEESKSLIRKLIFSPESLMGLIAWIWLIAGFYTPEKKYFIMHCLLIVTVGLFEINYTLFGGKKIPGIKYASNTLKIVITGLILYHHYFISQ